MPSAPGSTRLPPGPLPQCNSAGALVLPGSPEPNSGGTPVREPPFSPRFASPWGAPPAFGSEWSRECEARSESDENRTEVLRPHPHFCLKETVPGGQTGIRPGDHGGGKGRRPSGARDSPKDYRGSCYGVSPVAGEAGSGRDFLADSHIIVYDSQRLLVALHLASAPLRPGAGFEALAGPPRMPGSSGAPPRRALTRSLRSARGSSAPPIRASCRWELARSSFLGPARYEAAIPVTMASRQQERAG